MELKWTEEEFEWVEANLKQLGASTAVTREFRDQVYTLYNKLNGTNKKPTSCGRCWNGTKRDLVLYYNKIKNII